METIDYGAQFQATSMNSVQGPTEVSPQTQQLHLPSAETLALPNHFQSATAGSGNGHAATSSASYSDQPPLENYDLANNLSKLSEPDLPTDIGLNCSFGFSENHVPKTDIPKSDPVVVVEKDGSVEEQENSSRRKRRSRWDTPNEIDSSGGRKRKSRWADDEPNPAMQFPDFIGGIEFDPEIQQLNGRLLEISRMLQSGMPLDDRPDGARSPSPEPIYDNMGIRINTREYRARERLNRERQEIISLIIKKNPAFKPPVDYRPPKLQRKLYIPMKEYPGYNFIGLIIGPRGNTQKRMEKETGAKIVIRGKGSIKEGRLQQKRDLKADLAENEDLHVLVEADTQDSLDAAAGMLEKLLRPVDEVLNEHKRQQLRELAALNGTIRDEEFCKICLEPGHRQYACPSRTTTFKSDVSCTHCGNGGHPSIDCPMKGVPSKNMDEEYKKLLEELGGTLPVSVAKQNPTLQLGSGSNSPWAGGGAIAGVGITGLGINDFKATKEIDDTNLYVGYLPPTFDDSQLIELFSPFGDIFMAKVIKDKITGMCKGYGFVKYTNIEQANNAIASMNGYHLEGRTIAVRVAGKPPQPLVPVLHATPPGPPLLPVVSYPVINPPPVSVFPQFLPGSAPSNAPSVPPLAPVNYVATSLPWGLTPYAPYPYPPPGSSAYTSFATSPVPPYYMQYPPVQPDSSGMPSQVVSSEGYHCPPPGMESENGGDAHSVHSNVYPAPVPPSIQPIYATTPLNYPSYSVVPPLPSTGDSSADGSRQIADDPWSSDPQVLQPVSTTENESCQVDPDYGKLMSEIK